MKSVRHLILGLACVGQILADPVNLEAPSNALGASDLYGNVRIWREIEDVDFGNGLQLPLRLEFSSAHQNRSQYVGQGWAIPLLESKAFLKREKMMQVILLCGKSLYLRRDTTGVDTFQTLDREWKGVIKDNQITISRADGWELQFREGKLRQIRTDTGRKLIWDYSGDFVSEIREQGAGTLKSLKVVRDSDGLPTGLILNGKLHGFELGKRPMVKSTDGIRVIDQLVPTLAGWRWPDGGQEKYEFETTPEGMPTLKLTERDEVATDYAWNPANGDILSAGEWTYHIVQTNKAFGMPRIERSNSEGQKEFTQTNLKTGVTDRQTLDSGRRITQVFSSAGPLYGKIRKIEKVNEGGEKEPILQISYDENGKLLRRTDEMGFTTVFEYDEDGKLEGKKFLRPTNPKILERLKAKEEGMQKAIAGAATSSAVQDKLHELAFFYLHDLKQPDKAFALAPKFANKKMLFRLKAAAIAHNGISDYEEKIKGYRRLAKEFPDEEEYLQWMVFQSQEMVAAGLQ